MTLGKDGKYSTHPVCKEDTREQQLPTSHLSPLPISGTLVQQQSQTRSRAGSGAAAAAMVCADRQGRAWKMHDLLFLNQRALQPNQIETYALSIGLDIESFRACIKDDATMEVVRQDIAEGDALGVQGTPTWFINGWKEVGARSPDDLIGIIQHRLRTDQKKKAAAPAQ